MHTGLSRVTEEIHKYGAFAFIELTHQGLYGTNFPVFAPSDVPLRGDLLKPHVLNSEEIEAIGMKFANAALIAKKSGFDGVEIEAAHGLLVEQFLSPLTNTRTDDFGGSLDNRTRFAKLLIDRIKELCGRDFTVSARLGVMESITGGITPEGEGALIAKKFEEYGYTYVHADVGLGDKEKRLEPMSYAQGWRSGLAKALKDKGLKIPVAAVGVIREPDFAEQLLVNGVSDIVALGRTLIADPDWPIKAMYGKVESIRKCIGCSECIMSRHVLGTAIRCSVNPNVGKSESYANLIPSLNKKKVIVVGAGPAGLEASRVLTLRGHNVVLLEKEDKTKDILDLTSKRKCHFLVSY
ncbi:FAD-dependent monooxygenase [Caldisericum sp.]|uniref:oxidoreductase n=1 Tax=Caldisericum sp. TaxID=2499687 RepID=UPI003D140DD1